MAAILNRLKEEEEVEPSKPAKPMVHKPLLLTTRGLIHKASHLYNDFVGLIPHAKTDTAVSDEDFVYVDEIASDLRCDNVCLLQGRHKNESYMWLSKIPSGPSICLYIEDSESIKELNLIGNCLKGSRPLIFMDPSMDSTPVHSLAKQLLLRTFQVPHQDPHTKPFVDRALSFFVVEGKILVRHYQIQWGDEPSLAEIGPRMTLDPVFVLAGPFKGHKIWKNSTFTSPYSVGLEEKRDKAKRKQQFRDRQAEREERKLSIPKAKDKLKGLFTEPTE